MMNIKKHSCAIAGIGVMMVTSLFTACEDDNTVGSIFRTPYSITDASGKEFVFDNYPEYAVFLPSTGGKFIVTSDGYGYDGKNENTKNWEIQSVSLNGENGQASISETAELKKIGIESITKTSGDSWEIVLSPNTSPSVKVYQLQGKIQYDGKETAPWSQEWSQFTQGSAVDRYYSGEITSEKDFWIEYRK